MGEQGERTCWAFFFSRLNDRSISRKNQDSIERTSSVFPDSVLSHAFPSCRTFFREMVSSYLITLEARRRVFGE